jgi:hypothetical protein
MVRVDLPVGSAALMLRCCSTTTAAPTGLPGGNLPGVWFNTEDYLPGSTGFMLEAMEWWFFEHASYPWDTADFYAEVWNGDENGPVELLDSQLVSAMHYAGAFTYYDPPLECESNFWGLINTTLSAGGWPSVLGDNTPGEHSYFSDDMIVWDPGRTGDYFIRAHGEFDLSLQTDSWVTSRPCSSGAGVFRRAGHLLAGPSSSSGNGVDRRERQSMSWYTVKKGWTYGHSSVSPVSFLRSVSRRLRQVGSAGLR